MFSGFKLSPLNLITKPSQKKQVSEEPIEKSAPQARTVIRFQIDDEDEICINSLNVTYRRSAFLGIPLGTVFKPRPWQSTCDPEQLHLCGQPVTEAAHTSSAKTRAQTRQSAARFSGLIRGMISTQITSKSKLIGKSVGLE